MVADSQPTWDDSAKFIMTADVFGRPLRLKYFLRVPNVGDLVNPTLVGAISGRQPVHYPGAGKGHLLAIGSIMAEASKESFVWGTGVMHPDIGLGAAQPDNIFAVRGKRSLSALRQGGINIADVPLGDPGFLAAKILGIAKAARPDFKVGLVPHYVDRSHPVFRHLSAAPGAVDLNVHEDPQTFLEQMATCEVVVSSSLHGLVFAESLGIPNLWVTAGSEIGGGAFKYQDWFSTSARPQASAHALSACDTLEGLAARAELHDSTIDAGALLDAFPRGRIEAFSEPEARAVLPTLECRRRPTPVFLISFNRGPMLEQTTASIRRLATPTDIIVHDNGSDDPATLDVLAEFERDGARVMRGPAIEEAEDLNNVDETIRAYFYAWAEPTRYVVSDCDVDMNIAAPLALEVYGELLNRCRHAESVGPMLRIADIPLEYPLYAHVMNRHIEQFWHKEPMLTETKFGTIAYIDAPIDTTFSLNRAGEPFRRLKAGLRIYEPYEARHLDWYLTQENSTIYATSSSANISHWNNSLQTALLKGETLVFESYYVVKHEIPSGISVSLNFIRRSSR